MELVNNNQNIEELNNVTSAAVEQNSVFIADEALLNMDIFYNKEDFVQTAPSSVIFSKIHNNAKIYELAKRTNQQEEIVKSFKESKEIWDDTTLYNQDFEQVSFPIFYFPEDADLAIREEGSISTASLIELVGAIEDVKIRRMFNKKAKDSADVASTQTRNVKWNEIEHYGLNKKNTEKLFSKSVIKQFLLFHMLPIDNEGWLFDVPFKEIAQKLNISIRTVQNNNLALANAGLIKIEKERVKHFNYQLSRYDEKAEEGTAGYIKMSKKTFETLLKIDEVNTLRLTIRLYLRTIQEMARKTRFSLEAPKYTFDELKSILPAYKTNPKSIKLMLDKINHLFQNKLIDDEVYFIMEHNHKPHVQQEKIQNTINQVTLYLVKHYLSVFDKKDKFDLLQLANQYGLSKFLSAIKIFINDKHMIDHVNTSEYSLGLVLRQLLRFNNVSKSEFPLFIQ